MRAGRSPYTDKNPIIGVALLSRFQLEDIEKDLPGDDSDEQSRYIEATVMSDNPIRVASLYLPNGNPAPGPKYDYKLGWMERLAARAEALLATEEAFVLAGDYNCCLLYTSPSPRDRG